MKRIINGRRYDTDTAQLVAEFHNTPDRGDHHFYREELYRTKGGAWFVAGEGGPASRYRRTVGQNQWSSGEGLGPLTDGEAREWLEEHAKTAELEKYFGSAIVDA